MDLPPFRGGPGVFVKEPTRLPLVQKALSISGSFFPFCPENEV